MCSRRENRLSVNIISGSDRYATSVKLADELYNDNKFNDVYLVSITSTPDGLSIANLSTKSNSSVILVNSDNVNSEFMDFISKKRIKSIHIVGGVNSINKNIEDKFKVLEVERISGSDRYDTSRKIVEKAYPDSKYIFVADVKTSIDALVCGAVIPKTDTPMVLINDNDSSFSTWYKNRAVSRW